MPALVGRGSPGSPSRPAVRTPRLVLEHLLSVGYTGDYEASIHHAVKAKIREARPGYQWPRSHSFRTLLRHLRTLGLIEPTGAREQSPVPHMDPAIGFEPRDYVRLTPGSESRWEWEDPIGAIQELHYPGMTRGAAYYLSRGLVVPKTGGGAERVGSGLTLVPGLSFAPTPIPTSTLPVFVPAAPVAPEDTPSDDVGRTEWDDLNEQRQALRDISLELGRTGFEPEYFVHLDTLGRSFIEQAEAARAIWSDNAADIRRALGTLGRCVSALQAAGDRPGLVREAALSDCRGIAKSLARLFERPLKAGVG